MPRLPKPVVPEHDKAMRYVRLYPQEFSVDTFGKLFCNLCYVNVSVVKSFRVASHRNSAKHRRGMLQNGIANKTNMTLEANSSTTMTNLLALQAFTSAASPNTSMSPRPCASPQAQMVRPPALQLNSTPPAFNIDLPNNPRHTSPNAKLNAGGGDHSTRVIEAFLAADIPLDKLEHKSLKDLFLNMNHPLPGKQACKSKLKSINCKLQETVAHRLRQYDANVFAFLHERASSDDSKHISIFMGTVIMPEITYLVHNEFVTSNGGVLDVRKVCQLIDDVLKKFDIPRNKFVLLLSNANGHNIDRAAENLKFFYPDMIYSLCFDIKTLVGKICKHSLKLFPDVDEAINSLQKLIEQNNDLKEKLKAENLLPPVVTELDCGSWLRAVVHYAEHFLLVKNALSNLGLGDADPMLVAATDGVNLETNISNVATQHSHMLEMLEAAMDFADESGGEATTNGDGKAGADRTLAVESQWALGSSEYDSFLKCQASTVTVRRCFGMLVNMLLHNDKDMEAEHTRNHIACKYNAFLL